MAEQGQELGVYAISVVAQLVGTGQQNIRLYERKGLVTPDRTAGGTRQYSNADLAVLRRIGMNCWRRASTWRVWPRSWSWRRSTPGCGPNWTVSARAGPETLSHRLT